MKKTCALLMSIIMIILTSIPTFSVYGAKNKGYMWPIPGAWVRSGRYFSSSHNGLDLNVTNTSSHIYAISDGTVFTVYSGCNNFAGINNGSCEKRGICTPKKNGISNKYHEGYCNDKVGNGIIIYHENGVWSLYAHMSTVNSNLKSGSHITQGTDLGTIGATGYSTGIHAHFSMNKGTNTTDYWSNTFVNPLNYVEPDDNGIIEPVVPQCAEVSIIPSSFIGGKQVKFVTSESGATIKYKLNNGAWIDAQNNSTINLYATTKVQAKAVKSGYTDSTERESTISVEQLPKPNITTTYTDMGIRVEISDTNNNAEIHYTTDGTEPNSNSPKYEGGFIVKDKSKTIKAIAVSSGFVSSPILTRVITASAPSQPSAVLKSNNKIAVGDSAVISWSGVSNATYYNAILKKNGEIIDTKSTQGLQLAFELNEAGDYVISVQAANFIGTSTYSYPEINVTAMPDLTVKYIDYDGTIIGNEQCVRYGYDAIVPETPTRFGYDFTSWSESNTNITCDKTIQANYKKKKYTVKFKESDGTLISSQRVEFESSATAPLTTDLNIPTGYVFAGWYVEPNNNSGTDWTKVDGDMALIASYKWENEELPIHTTIKKAMFDETDNGQFYTLNLSFISAPEQGTIKGRVIATIKTSEGKAIRSETEDVVLYENTQKDVSMTIAESKLGSIVEVVVVGLDKDNDNKTGGAYSELVSSNIVSSVNYTEWSDWLEEKPNNYDQVEESLQYRYNTKITATSNSSKTMQGYVYEKTDEHVGSWSGWQDSAISEINNDSLKRQVSTQIVESGTHYKYSHYCRSNHSVAYSGYDSCYTYHEVVLDYQLPYIGTFSTGGGNKYGNSSTLRCANNCYYWSNEEVLHDYKTQWRYLDTTYTHYFYKASDWSNWSFDKPTSYFNIETRTVYRGRNYADLNANNEDNSGETYTITGKLTDTDKDFSGEKATVMVYKKSNSDPTESQLEYVSQIDIGDENNYSFEVKPKEEITSETGDYIVSLGLEGATRLVNVYTIQAPLPTYTITFMADGNLLSTEEVVLHDNAIIPIVPEKEGYQFTGWDEQTTNITEDLTITALYDKKEYSVIFVDWVNNAISVEKLPFGSPISSEAFDLSSKNGKHFKGWDVVLNGQDVVNDDTVVTAVWETENYTVNFVDENGETISTQTVEYGNSAELPSDLVVDGYVFKGWSTTEKWWAVDKDMNIYPILSYENTAEMPIYEQISCADGNNIVFLSSPTEDSTIYYTIDGTEPNSTSIEYVPEEGIIFTSDITVMAVAMKSTCNSSPIVAFDIEYEDTYNCYICFDTEQNDTFVASTVLTSGELLSKPSDPIKSGYKFAGWYTDSNYIEEYDFSEPVYSDILLYAKWISTDGLGDVNNDGNVNNADASIIMKYVSGIISESDFGTKYNKDSADVDGNNKIDILDAIAILKDI